MALYKVIQDIEAEDKLLGPLTLRQFIYAAVVVVMGFTAFKLAAISPFFVIPFLPPMVFFGMLAAPFGHDQPSEVWMLAKFRFFLKPRKRIWNQDGIQQLVSITVPKKVDRHLTNGLNQYEVKSRLQALASTLDSRGWAIKNVSVNMFNQPSYLTGNDTESDRLLDASSLPQEVPAYEVYAADDIMDERSNPTAQHLNTMVTQSQQDHRTSAAATMQNSADDTQGGQPTADYWFMNQSEQPVPAPQPGYATFNTNPVVFPGMDGDQVYTAPAATTSLDEEKLLEKIHTDKAHEQPIYSHVKVLNPIGAKSRESGAESPELDALSPIVNDSPLSSAASMPPTDDVTPLPAYIPPPAVNPIATNPAILRLANNDDLNVATLAREAEKASPKPLEGEVTISLR